VVVQSVRSKTGLWEDEERGSEKTVIVPCNYSDGLPAPEFCTGRNIPLYMAGFVASGFSKSVALQIVAKIAGEICD
jgi:hypothetical protein